MARSDKESDDNFGGIWTNEKLDILEDYLKAFAIALKKKKYTKIYIDGFAGSGNVNIVMPDKSVKSIPGSVKRALRTDPLFDYYYFIDLNSKKVRQLKEIQESVPQANIVAIQDDANLVIPTIIKSVNWLYSRGVVFLDPYHTNVKWETITSIAQSGALDFWYLFPIGAVRRLLPIHVKEDLKCFSRVSEIFGCPKKEWFGSLYKMDRSQQLSLFDSDEETSVQYSRDFGDDKIIAFLKKRLETIFPYVSKADYTLKNGKKSALFVLIFAVSNPNKNAQILAERIANHILESKA